MTYLELMYIVWLIRMYLFYRIKEEPSEIHFPELDEIDEVNNAEQLLNLNGMNTSNRRKPTI